MKYLVSLAVLTVICIIVSLTTITLLQRRLDDCLFEVNHLQTKMDRFEELGEYETALYQLLTPLGWAQLKAATEIINQKKYREYERYEQPLIEGR